MKTHITLISMALAILVGCLPIEENPTTPTTPTTPASPTNQVQKQKTTAALIIGVENGYAGKCSGSLLDAQRMSKLVSNYTKNVTCLVDEQATTLAVSDTMSDLVANNDLTIIYYSGHGGSQPSTDPFEDDYRDEYLCLYDKPFLDNSIWDIVNSTTNRVFLIFDCCHSATMYRAPMFDSKKKILCAALDPSKENANLLCWSGCQDDAYSYGNSSGGLFTNAILKYFSANKTYASMWKLISEDFSLKEGQTVNVTVVGVNFTGNLFMK